MRRNNLCSALLLFENIDWRKSFFVSSSYFFTEKSNFKTELVVALNNYMKALAELLWSSHDFSRPLSRSSSEMSELLTSSCHCSSCFRQPCTPPDLRLSRSCACSDRCVQAECSIVHVGLLRRVWELWETGACMLKLLCSFGLTGLTFSLLSWEFPSVVGQAEATSFELELATR